MLVPAPVWFSMMNCWPTRSDNHCPVSRATMSAEPPVRVQVGSSELLYWGRPSMAKERNVALAPGDFGTSPWQLQDEATFPSDTLQQIWQLWRTPDISLFVTGDLLALAWAALSSRWSACYHYRKQCSCAAPGKETPCWIRLIYTTPHRSRGRS